MKRSSKKELIELTEKIIHLRDVEGMTYVDIGKHINKSYCTVMRLYKASGRTTTREKPQEYITVSNEQTKTYEDYIKDSDAMTQACWRSRIKGTDKL